jgi:hypothetical protein
MLLVNPDFLASDFIADHECRNIGRGLADSGFGLVSGGWRGVDHIVARSFAEAVKETEGNLDEQLIQFVEQDWTPDFPGGRFVTAI